jgi:hypothetical protein
MILSVFPLPDVKFLNLLGTDRPLAVEFGSVAKMIAPDISLSNGSVIFVEDKAFRGKTVRLDPEFLKST